MNCPLRPLELDFYRQDQRADLARFLAYLTQAVEFVGQFGLRFSAAKLVQDM